MSHKASGSKSVIAALVGNIFITIFKAFAAVFSGSASMFAEGIHSLADTLNQTLLLIGLKRSKRPADSNRGYGYGIERFFWSLLSACGILFIGAGITIYHSIDALIHHHSGEVYVFNRFTIIILCISFFVEGITFLVALFEIKSGRKPRGGFFANADPVTLAVLYEDGAAVLGVVVVLFAQLLIYVTGNGIFDPIAGIIVSLILGFLAIVLILKNYQYIIGKSIDEDVKEEITEFLLADPCIENISEFKSVAIDFNVYRIYTTVEWNGSHLYSEIYEKGDLRDEFNEIKDDFAEFTKLTFKMTDRIPRLVGNHIDKIEKKLKEQFPEIAYIDIEIN
jgi:zinc transporter 9